MNRYTVVVEPSNRVIGVEAESEKEAHKKAWAKLTDEERDAAESLDVVDAGVPIEAE